MHSFAGTTIQLMARRTARLSSTRRIKRNKLVRLGLLHDERECSLLRMRASRTRFRILQRSTAGLLLSPILFDNGCSISIVMNHGIHDYTLNPRHYEFTLSTHCNRLEPTTRYFNQARVFCRTATLQSRREISPDAAMPTASRLSHCSFLANTSRIK